MKVKINESDYHMSIHMQPETLEEVSMLARFSMNYKKQSPDVFMSFSQWNTDKVPYCNISMQKVNTSNQNTVISNKKP